MNYFPAFLAMRDAMAGGVRKKMGSLVRRGDLMRCQPEEHSLPAGAATPSAVHSTLRVKQSFIFHKECG
jgi:hypothetical protein